MHVSLRRPLFLLLLFFGIIISITSSQVRAQSCDPIPEGGGEGISVSASIDGTSTQLSEGGVVPAGTRVRLDSTAFAGGSCSGKAWYCQTTPCTCEGTGYIYQRTINHTNVKVDITSSGVWNGTYTVGTVQFLNAYDHVLSTGAGNSTGPNGFTLAIPGTYTFRFQGIINITPCNMQPDHTNEATITLQVAANDDAVNRGPTSCDSGVGKPVIDPGRPVNVTNGNMYIEQTDYRLPGIGDGLEITRTYNSRNQTGGLFGYGWSSMLDESLIIYGANLVRLNLPDGRAVYLGRPSGGSVYTPKQPLNFYGQIVKNVDNTYTLTFKDGRIHQFNANGRLVSFADRNGNMITLTLNTSGNPTAISDASGRTITLTYDSYTKIATMSDSLGTIATYVHAFLGRLTSVTYADGSKYVFTDVFSGNNVYLTTVKDALNNVLESHTYDSQGRALTSEKAGNGTERYTLTYVSATETDVTDALNHVTKYFFDTTKGRNVVTLVEGSCGCGNSQITQWTYDNQLNVLSKTES